MALCEATLRAVVPSCGGAILCSRGAAGLTGLTWFTWFTGTRGRTLTGTGFAHQMRALRHGAGLVPVRNRL